MALLTSFPELMAFYTSILQEYSSLHYTPSPKKNPPPAGEESLPAQKNSRSTHLLDGHCGRTFYFTSRKFGRKLVVSFVTDG